MLGDTVSKRAVCILLECNSSCNCSVDNQDGKKRKTNLRMHLLHPVNLCEMPQSVQNIGFLSVFLDNCGSTVLSFAACRNRCCCPIELNSLADTSGLLGDRGKVFFLLPLIQLTPPPNPHPAPQKGQYRFHIRYWRRRETSVSGCQVPPFSSFFLLFQQFLLLSSFLGKMSSLSSFYLCIRVFAH